MATDAASKQGFLSFEFGGWNSWEKRFCEVRDGELRYAKLPQQPNEGIISLMGAGMIAACERKKKKEFCFRLETPARVWHLLASSEEDCLSWVDSLVEEKLRANGKVQVPTIPRPCPLHCWPPAKGVSMDEVDFSKIVCLTYAEHRFATIGINGMRDLAATYLKHMTSLEVVSFSSTCPDFFPRSTFPHPPPSLQLHLI